MERACSRSVQGRRRLRCGRCGVRGHLLRRRRVHSINIPFGNVESSNLTSSDALFALITLFYWLCYCILLYSLHSSFLSDIKVSKYCNHYYLLDIDLTRSFFSETLTCRHSGTATCMGFPKKVFLRRAPRQPRAPTPSTSLAACAPSTMVHGQAVKVFKIFRYI